MSYRIQYSAFPNFHASSLKNLRKNLILHSAMIKAMANILHSQRRYMKYTESMMDEMLNPPSVIMLKMAAAMMSRQTQTVMILVRMSILTVQVGIKI